MMARRVCYLLSLGVAFCLFFPVALLWVMLGNHPGEVFLGWFGASLAFVAVLRVFLLFWEW